MGLKDNSRTRTAFSGLYTTSRTTGDYSLLVLDGPHQGESLRLDREFVRIGRAEWCDLVLHRDDLTSKVHCECMLDEKGVRIRDLGSRNGVVLGGYRIFDAYLKDGAEFRVGNTLLKLESHQQRRELEISYQDASGSLVGKSPKMRKLFSMLPRLAQRKVTTLLLGETGTGKTSIAEAIHKQAQDDSAPFVVVNCGALPASLIEAQLFGYEKGAFTGANKSHKGFFEQAHGGTLFLDEIAELPLELQPKLLDVIERKKVRPIGAQRDRDVDFHLIAATLRDLSSEISEGRFREDLYFRLSVVELDVPSLRERPEDFHLIVEKLVQDLNPDHPIGFTEEALQKLKRYPWPGNIRELRNILERALTFLEGDALGAEDIQLPSSAQVDARGSTSLGESDSALAHLMPPTPFQEHPPFPLKDLLSDIEKEIIAQALLECERDVQDASNILTVSPAWLYARIRKYKLRTKNKKRSAE